MKNDLSIDTDKQKLNLEFIHSFISKSYWAEDRTFETMKILVENSLNFGIYINDNQIGYARIVTDYAQFAYLMDLFISKEFQGKGYSKILMNFILNYEDLQQVKVWRLATQDAHFLYDKFGFKPLKNPEKMMELIKN